VTRHVARESLANKSGFYDLGVHDSKNFEKGIRGTERHWNEEAMGLRGGMRQSEEQRANVTRHDARESLANKSWFCDLTVMIPDFESGSPSSTLGRTLIFLLDGNTFCRIG
jgi:hypothetical protein